MSFLFKIVFVHHLPVFSATVVNLINATIAYNIFCMLSNFFTLWKDIVIVSDSPLLLLNNKSANPELFFAHDLFLKGQPRPPFHLFLAFSNDRRIFTSNKCDKWSLQYAVPGFELTISWLWVSYHHQTWAPALQTTFNKKTVDLTRIWTRIVEAEGESDQCPYYLLYFFSCWYSKHHF